jgi:sec-independent protein translocase protein TatA
MDPHCPFQPHGDPAMFGIGPTEMVIVGFIALLLFGNRLPSVMRSLGKGISEFKEGMNDISKPLE